jgi:hypothetical protein
MSSVKRRKQSRKEILSINQPTTEAKLEAFMDKLSMWQLMGNVDDKAERAAPRPDELDWMQTFCRDIVEPE